MASRVAIPKRVERSIWEEAGDMCPFCQEDDRNVLIIHHINKWSESKNNNPENLILACSNCHSKIHSQSISEIQVREVKANLKTEVTKKKNNVLKFPQIINEIHWEGGSNSGFIVNNLHISSKNPIKFEPPQGVIASDWQKKNYTKYLIDKYNEFKSKDYYEKNFKYSKIYTKIKNIFKCNWESVPVHRFEELVVFLQSEIDKTMIGRSKKKQGQRLYRPYEDYLRAQKATSN